MKTTDFPSPRRPLLIALASALTLAAGCGKEEPGGAEGGPPPRPEMVFPVTLGEVTRGPLMETTPVLGTVRWRRRVVIKSEVSGVVVKVAAAEGETVAEGGALVAIDDTDYRLVVAQRQAELEMARREQAKLKTGTRAEVIAQLKAAAAQTRADLATATDELTRTRKLVREGVRTTSELTRTEASHAAATAKLAEAGARLEEAQNGPTADDHRIAEAATAVAAAAARRAAHDLSKCAVAAPFAAVLLERWVEPGAYVTPGTALVELVDSSETEVILELGEKYVSAAAAGRTIEVTVDALPGETFVATVIGIIPVADQGSRSFRVRTRVDNADGRLLPGMFVRGQLTIRSKDGALQVPADAITLKDQGAVVFAVESGAARLVPVRLGISGGGQVEVMADGLADGAKVVTTGGEVLFPGAKVMDTAAMAGPGGPPGPGTKPAADDAPGADSKPAEDGGE
jgi:HlyD family secretion protein